MSLYLSAIWTSATAAALSIISLVTFSFSSAMAQSTPGSNVAVKPKREHTVRNVRLSSMKVSRVKLKKELKLKKTAGHYSQTESRDGNSFRIAIVNALFSACL